MEKVWDCTNCDQVRSSAWCLITCPHHSTLRVLVVNPESHQTLVEAKVIPAIVKQVWATWNGHGKAHGSHVYYHMARITATSQWAV